MMKKICLLWAVCILLPVSSQAAAFDWQDYDGLLHDYVQVSTVDGVRIHALDYQSWSEDARWQDLLHRLSIADASSFASREEKLSFWINSYNILAIDMVIRHWPVRSIKDIGSFFSSVWGKDVAVVAHKMRSLDEIEHGILRPMAEPRIHFAIVCASVSCPDLRMQAYRAEQLNGQLDAQVQDFLHHEQKGLFLSAAGVRLSKIFQWFADDFAVRGGVMAFVHAYRADIAADDNIVGYFDYQWTLNALTAARR